MPETNGTNTNTPNTPVEPSNAQPATPVAQEPQTPATEPNKGQEAQPANTQPAEPVYTLDSYKDLDNADFLVEAGLEKDDLTSFKQLGVNNKLSPEALKAVAKWSLDNIKEQREAFAKVQEGWRQENAKKYGDNLKNVKTNVGRVLADFDKSGNFAKLLQDAGAEENPATLEFLNGLADVLLEKGSVNPNASPEGKPFTLEDIYKPKQ